MLAVGMIFYSVILVAAGYFVGRGRAKPGSSAPAGAVATESSRIAQEQLAKQHEILKAIEDDARQITLAQYLNRRQSP